MERRWTSVSVLLLLAALLGSRVAAAQDCPSINSSQCKAFASKLAAGACIKPGNVFVFEDKWKSALRTKIAFNSQKRVRFFYVVDGRNIATKYNSLFVGIDRIREQSTTSKIKLTQNWSFRFKTNEEKLKYSRAVKPGGLPTQPIRKWSYLPGVGNVFLLKANDVISKFDIPQAIDEFKSRATCTALSIRDGKHQLHSVQRRAQFGC